MLLFTLERETHRLFDHSGEPDAGTAVRVMPRNSAERETSPRLDGNYGFRQVKHFQKNRIKHLQKFLNLKGEEKKTLVYFPTN